MGVHVTVIEHLTALRLTGLAVPSESISTQTEISQLERIIQTVSIGITDRSVPAVHLGAVEPIALVTGSALAGELLSGDVKQTLGVLAAESADAGHLDLRTVSAISGESWLALTNMSEGVDIEDTGGVVMTTVTLVPVGLADQSVPTESLPTLTPVPLLGVVVDTLRIRVTNLRGLVTLKG